MKEVYSLRELVKEIYGDNEEKGEVFESNYKELQRIDNIIRKTSDFEHTKGIMAQNKDNYVRFIKDIISNSDARKTMERLNKGKDVKEEDFENLKKIYIGNNLELKFKVDKYDELTEKITVMNSKLLKTLQAIQGYFVEDLFELEKSIFNETFEKFELLTDEYKKNIDKISKEAVSKCKQNDELDNKIYEKKILEILIKSMDSKKFTNQYNNELKKKKKNKKSK